MTRALWITHAAKRSARDRGGPATTYMSTSSKLEASAEAGPPSSGIGYLRARKVRNPGAFRDRGLRANSPQSEPLQLFAPEVKGV